MKRGLSAMTAPFFMLDFGFWILDLNRTQMTRIFMNLMDYYFRD